MKKEINLTEEEKIDFLVKLETDENCRFLTKKVDEGRKLFFSYQCVFTPMIFGAWLLAGLISPPVFGFFPHVVLAKIAVDFAICLPMSISHKRRDSDILSYITEGKVNRKQYLNLLKSGELENWKQTYKNEVEKSR